jgi:hypothetical protein
MTIHLITLAVAELLRLTRRFVTAALNRSRAGFNIAVEIRTVGTEAAAAMASAAATETILTVALFMTVLSGLIAVRRRLLLAATGNEGRQAGHFRRIASVLMPLVRLMLVGLMLRPTMLGLVARRKGLCVARQIGLRLWLRRLREALLILSNERLTVFVTVVVTVVGGAGRRARLRRRVVVIGILLTKLFLRRGNQAEVMFGMLKVIFRRHRIA